MCRSHLGRLVMSFGMMALLVAPIAVISPSAAFAQQDINRELDSIKRSLADLQRFIYNGQQGSAPQIGQSAAAPSADVAARLQVQIQELERLVRQMTGKAEELDFKIRRVEQKLDTALSDIDFRLTQLEGVAPAVPGPVAGAAAGGGQPLIPVPNAAGNGGANVVVSGGTTVISADGNQPVTQGGGEAQPVVSSSDGTLGSLIMDANGNVIGGQINPSAAVGSTPGSGTASQTAGTQAAPAPATVDPAAPVERGAVTPASANASTELPNEPRALYDYSLVLLRQQAYADAESALRVFLDRHGEHQLVGAALYWLGETHYVRGDYREAAFSFVDVYSEHQDSNKVPDALLKLGMSLHALGNTSEACNAFKTLRTEYPSARAAVLKLTEDRSAEYGCQS